MNKYIFSLLALLSFNLAAENNAQNAFFKNLASLCGKTFVGTTLYPDNASDSFAGMHLEIKVVSCNQQEVRIPFNVGEDTSRTWVFSQTDKGLLFKHDHRHKDGTPHELTMYGGLSDGKGTSRSQSFPADEETKQLVPEGATNVWLVSISKDKSSMIYFLTRHGKPRYKAEFKLVK